MPNPPQTAPSALETLPDVRVGADEIPALRVDTDSLQVSLQPAQLFLRQQQERLVLDSLYRFFADKPVSELKVLDFGCMDGHLLPFLMGQGFLPHNLQALGLRKQVLDALQAVHPTLPAASLRPERLPYAEGSFDVVVMASVMSAVFDMDTRLHFAVEAQRLLKPGGLLLWYDLKPLHSSKLAWQKQIYHWLCHLDRESVEFLPPSALAGEPLHRKPVDWVEVQLLLDQCTPVRFKETGMYGPVAHLLADTSWSFLSLLTHLPVLKTHYYGEFIKTAGSV